MQLASLIKSPHRVIPSPGPPLPLTPLTYLPVAPANKQNSSRSPTWVQLPQAGFPQEHSLPPLLLPCSPQGNPQPKSSPHTSSLVSIAIYFNIQNRVLGGSNLKNTRRTKRRERGEGLSHQAFKKDPVKAWKCLSTGRREGPG